MSFFSPGIYTNLAPSPICSSAGLCLGSLSLPHGLEPGVGSKLEESQAQLTCFCVSWTAALHHLMSGVSSTIVSHMSSVFLLFQ